MEHHDSHHMQQLLQYITHNRANGVAEAHIREALIQSGWPEHLVDQGMGPYSQVPAPPPVPQAMQHQPHPHHEPQVQPPQKYKVFKAFSEAWAAMRANAATFVVSMIVAVGAMILSLLPMALLVLGLAKGLESDDGSAILAVLSLVGIFAVIWAWYVLVASFMFSVIAFAVNDGANRHRSTVGSVLSRATGVFGRVAMTNVWSGLIALGPPLVLFVIVVTVVASGSAADDGSLLGLVAVAPLVMLLSLVWILLCSVRFALAPYIAAFEPHVAPREAITRSYRLLRDGGIWFIWKLILIALAISLILSAFTGMPVSELDRSQNPLVTMVQLMMTVIAVATMLMLYRNRYARHHR